MHMSLLLKPIDNFLNRMTMYRVLIMSLGAISFIAIVLSFCNILSFGGFQLLRSLGVIFFVGVLVNFVCAKMWKAPVNYESTVITILILFLILPPAFNLTEIGFLALASTIAMISKYVVSWKHKHIFNPAALSAFLMSFTALGGAIWWVGSKTLLPVVAIAVFLVVRKIRRSALFFSAMGASVITVVLLGINTGSSVVDMLFQHFLSWPIVFFAGIMITEPLSMPPKKHMQILYGAGIGILSSWPFHIGKIYGSPEFALLVGNVFAYVYNIKQRLSLVLEDKILLAKDTYEFIFRSPKFSFEPGQYLEWTLPHTGSDVRGSRRYFTIASSPTEDHVRLGVKFSSPSSTFKKHLLNMQKGEKLFASQLGGDFVPPKDPQEKLVFIAGGIGITPFRSMIQYFMDKHEKRDVVLFYSNRSHEDIAYQNVLKQAQEKIGMKYICMITNTDQMPENWTGECGFITESLIQKYVPDFLERKFYLSGPTSMVDAYKTLLMHMSIPRKNIVTDYFPGFA